MGKGNCCVFGDYEGLYYIDNDDLLVYRRENEDGEVEFRMLGELSYSDMIHRGWEFSETDSYFEQKNFEIWFKERFHSRFPSFVPLQKDRWISDTRRAILESDLFYIAVEDNEWAVAVELIQKEESYGDGWMHNLQKRHHQRYLDEMKRLLLKYFPSIGTYSGAWTSGRLTREEYEEEIARKVGA